MCSGIPAQISVIRYQKRGENDQGLVGILGEGFTADAVSFDQSPARHYVPG